MRYVRVPGRRRQIARRTIRLGAAGIAALGMSYLTPIAAADPLSAAGVAAAYDSAVGEIDVPAANLVDMPTDLADGVRIGTGRYAIKVTPAAVGHATVLGDARSIYRANDVSTVVEATSGGARIATVSTDSGTAQQSFSYDLALPAGASMRPVGDGVDIIASGGILIARIAPPWAKDANGKALPTKYRIERNTLTQTVDTAGATFPIVADPRVENLGFLGLSKKVWFTRHETEVLWRQQAAGAVVTFAGIAACALIPPPLDVVCGLAITTLAADFYTNLREAHAHNHCLTLELGLPASIDWNDEDGSYCEH